MDGALRAAEFSRAGSVEQAGVGVGGECGRASARNRGHQIGRLDHPTLRPNRSASRRTQRLSGVRRHDPGAAVGARLDRLARVVLGHPAAGRLDVDHHPDVVWAGLEQPGVEVARLRFGRWTGGDVEQRRRGDAVNPEQPDGLGEPAPALEIDCGLRPR